MNETEAQDHGRDWKPHFLPNAEKISSSPSSVLCHKKQAHDKGDKRQQHACTAPLQTRSHIIQFAQSRCALSKEKKKGEKKLKKQKSTKQSRLYL
jgi:hypothetical protein